MSDDETSYGAEVLAAQARLDARRRDYRLTAYTDGHSARKRARGLKQRGRVARCEKCGTSWRVLVYRGRRLRQYQCEEPTPVQGEPTAVCGGRLRWPSWPGFAESQGAQAIERVDARPPSAPRA